jgi:hypothetical protein
MDRMSDAPSRLPWNIMSTGRDDNLFINRVHLRRFRFMTEVPDNKNEPSAIDDAATEQATGGYTFTAGAPAPLGGGNGQWAQQGIDHNMSLLHGPQSGTPGDAMQGFHAGAPSIGLGGNAFGVVPNRHFHQGDGNPSSNDHPVKGLDAASAPVGTGFSGFSNPAFAVHDGGATTEQQGKAVRLDNQYIHEALNPQHSNW